MGKLLLKQHDLNGAKELAAANDGYNMRLLSLINQQETMQQ